jgi:hypothetical protein
LLTQEEIWQDDKGAGVARLGIADRRLLNVHGSIVLASPQVHTLLPQKHQSFTTSNLALASCF